MPTLPPIENNGLVMQISGDLNILPMQPAALINDIPPVDTSNIKLDKVSVVDVSNLDPNDTDVGWLDLLKVFFRQNLVNYVTDSSPSGGIMETTIGDSITNILVRLVLKVGGGVLLTLGVTSSTLTPIIAGVVTILIGAVASWFNNKKLAAQPSPTQAATITALTSAANSTTGAVTTAQ